VTSRTLKSMDLTNKVAIVTGGSRGIGKSISKCFADNGAKVVVTSRKFGDNARAALITRGLAEIVRLGLAKGARAETLMGLSGLGDLTLTCNAMQSRNFSLGAALGEGRHLNDILKERNAVTEGVFSASSITALADRLGIEMPICHAVDRIVNRDDAIDRVIADLLSRPFAREQQNPD